MLYSLKIEAPINDQCRLIIPLAFKPFAKNFVKGN